MSNTVHQIKAALAAAGIDVSNLTIEKTGERQWETEIIEITINAQGISRDRVGKLAAEACDRASIGVKLAERLYIGTIEPISDWLSNNTTAGSRIAVPDHLSPPGRKLEIINMGTGFVGLYDRQKGQIALESRRSIAEYMAIIMTEVQPINAVPGQCGLVIDHQFWRGRDAHDNDVMTCAMCSSPIDVANDIARIAAERQAGRRTVHRKQHKEVQPINAVPGQCGLVIDHQSK